MVEATSSFGFNLAAYMTKNTAGCGQGRAETCE